MSARTILLGGNRFNLQSWSLERAIAKIGVRLSGWTSDLISNKMAIINDLTSRLSPIERAYVRFALQAAIPDSATPGKTVTKRQPAINLVASYSDSTFSIEFHLPLTTFDELFPASLDVDVQPQEG